MQTMTYTDFQQLLKGDMAEYYIGRWEYYQAVIELIQQYQPKSVLELGPGQNPIVMDGDIMVTPDDDSWGKPEKWKGHIYAHDATEKPWPVQDKQYDLFIALQVWEHLSNKQSRAFREVMRIAKAAILSFPFNWHCPKGNANYPEHHQIDEELIADWTLGFEPVKKIVIKRTGEKVSKGPRLIYFWQFE